MKRKEGIWMLACVLIWATALLGWVVMLQSIGPMVEHAIEKAIWQELNKQLDEMGKPK